MVELYLEWIDPCNTGEKVRRRREMKVSNNHADKENAEANCPLV